MDRLRAGCTIRWAHPSFRSQKPARSRGEIMGDGDRLVRSPWPMRRSRLRGTTAQSDRGYTQRQRFHGHGCRDPRSADIGLIGQRRSWCSRRNGAQRRELRRFRLRCPDAHRVRVDAAPGRTFTQPSRPRSRGGSKLLERQLDLTDMRAMIEVEQSAHDHLGDAELRATFVMSRSSIALWQEQARPGSAAVSVPSVCARLRVRYGVE